MPLEIERKFLVVGDDWRECAMTTDRFCQGYLAKTSRGSMRVRRAGERAWVTVKGQRDGPSRPEFEYPIPVEDAEQMLRELCLKPLIEKVRHRIDYGGLVWEVDVFCGQAEGLVLAEVELERPDQPILKPHWVGAEVTADPRFRNSAILSGTWKAAAPRELRGFGAERREASL